MKKILIYFFLFSFSITKVYAQISYFEILENPTDLKLNLQYAKERESDGDFKSVIATLERLTALYPKNIDLKLYLLSISVKTDSTEKVLKIINEIRQSDEIDENTKKRVAQVFDDINKKKIDETKKEERQKARKLLTMQNNKEKIKLLLQF